MQTAVKKISEASNKQAAAWRLADSTLKRGNTERLPLLKCCKSDSEMMMMYQVYFRLILNKSMFILQRLAHLGASVY